MDDREVRERVERIEALLEAVESLDDPARTTALAAVEALVDLYGEGLTRIVERVAATDRGELAAAFADDELVSHLLLLHDLHPDRVEDRVGQALAEVRPYLRSHGGDVELLRVENAIAYLRLEGSCSGCPSSAMTLRLAVEDAVRKAAPELEGIEAEGVSEAPPAVVPLTSVQRLSPPERGAPPANGGVWSVAGALPELGPGGTVVKEVAGEPVLFVSLGESVYAYRHVCPACGDALTRAAHEGAELVCAGCARRYDVRRAGRSVDDPDLYVEPIPLLRSDAGIVKVALAAPAA
ncbi:MAG: NifU family protein [Actinomycetota bacterium]|nr:NifU family protein [Actinomycetota bacterium]